MMTRTRGAARRAQHPRQGFALILVIVTIGVCTAITFGFFRLQGVNLKLTENSRTRDLALEAAHSGIAIAIRDMQKTSWGGIGTSLNRTLLNNSEGTATATIDYLTYTPTSDEGVPEDYGLRVLVSSTGNWTPVGGVRSITRKVKAVMRLAPRGPTRPLVTEDYALAEDVKTNPTNFDTIQSYAAFASDKDSNDYFTFMLDPGSRIEGKTWIREDHDLFYYSNFPTTTRDDLLSAIGSRWVNPSPRQVYHAHIFGREQNPSGSDIVYAGSNVYSTDTIRLQSSYSTNSGSITAPSITTSDYTSYRIYDNGPLYYSDVISSSIQNVTLRPTTTNPLGIYRTTAGLNINSNVTIQGTLVVPGSVTFGGTEITLSSHNWSGDLRLNESVYWPRLPAVVATGGVTFNSATRAIIDGEIYSNGDLYRYGADFEFRAYSTLNLAGTATATPIQQPWSEIQLYGFSDLSSVTADGYCSIWLEQGNGGRWYPIVGVNATNSTLTVVGEVRLTSAVNCRIRPNRIRYVDLQGPVRAKHLVFEGAPSWAISWTDWGVLRSTWATQNSSSPINFTTWLENTANVHWLGASYPYSYSQYGITLEPTCTIRKDKSTYFRLSPTMLEPYSDSGSGSAHSGFRWQVLSWREI
ncbi:MAG: hypothetical protein KDA68_12000 [Planctomycetaceae bacterium]|nr:hypothetical protein [Planctomycetaceae bacterium]